VNVTRVAGPVVRARWLGRAGRSGHYGRPDDRAVVL